MAHDANVMLFEYILNHKWRDQSLVICISNEGEIYGLRHEIIEHILGHRMKM